MLELYIVYCMKRKETTFFFAMQNHGVYNAFIKLVWGNDNLYTLLVKHLPAAGILFIFMLYRRRLYNTLSNALKSLHGYTLNPIMPHVLSICNSLYRFLSSYTTTKKFTLIICFDHTNICFNVCCCCMRFYKK